MCAIDDGEGVDFSLATFPKARKDHKCCECRRVIRKGEVYKKDSYGFDGTARSDKVCMHCNLVIHDWLDTQCGGHLLNGGGMDDFYEHLYEGWDDNSNLARLYILAARKQWTRKDGSLYNIEDVKRRFC